MTEILLQDLKIVGHKRVFQAMSRTVARLKGKRVIYISSDAVFDGSKGMYCEDDLPSPRTPYGINKLLCENLVRQSIPDHCIVRTSYIYGYSLGTLDPRLADAQRLCERGKCSSVSRICTRVQSTLINWLRPLSR
jgi:dTDP-4-dehydrorhamnose reductase